MCPFLDEQGLYESVKIRTWFLASHGYYLSHLEINTVQYTQIRTPLESLLNFDPLLHPQTLSLRISSLSGCRTWTRLYVGNNAFSIPKVDWHLQVEMTLNCVNSQRDRPICSNFDVDALDSNVGPTLRILWDGVSRLAFGDLERPSPRRTDDVFLHKFIVKMCTAALQDTAYICEAIHEIRLLVALGFI
ncbi:hypothetical protein BDR05DRAFT_953801, partial [Suillus weaverae]